MKQQVNPAVFWALLAIVVVVVLVVGFKMFGPKSAAYDTKPDDALMKKVQSGQPLYSTPPGYTGPGSNGPGAPGGPGATNSIPSGMMGTPPPMGGSK